MTSTTHYGTTTTEAAYGTADNELITQSSGAGSGTSTATIAVSQTENSHSFITPAGTPGFVTWPTSDGSNYQASINVSAINSSLSLNDATFYRVNAAASATNDSATASWSSTTGTGVKTCSVANSVSFNDSSPLATDRLQLTVSVTHDGT
jgi:hypothetical protein